MGIFESLLNAINDVVSDPLVTFACLVDDNANANSHRDDYFFSSSSDSSPQSYSESTSGYYDSDDWFDD